MAQENDSDVSTGVTVTTTPKISFNASLTAKLAASADTSTAFNISSATSLVGFDTFSLGCLGLSTSKKIGATVTYQSGINANNFATTHKNKAYSYARYLTFFYINGMALRGKSINILNKTDLKTASQGALSLMTVGSLATPIVPFVVNKAGEKNNWQTSAEKKKAEEQKKLDDKKARVTELQDDIDEEEKRIAELESKKKAGTITDKETNELNDLYKQLDDDNKELQSKQEDIAEADAKNQKQQETSNDIGKSPDKAASQKITDFSTVASAGASTFASVVAAASAAKTIFKKPISMAKGIYMTASDGDIVMNSLSSAKAKFSVNAFAAAEPAYANKQASMDISAEALEKKAEFNSIAKFAARAGTGTAMICKEDSVDLMMSANSMNIKSDAVDVKVGGFSMNIKPNSVNVECGVGQLEVKESGITLCKFRIQK